MNGYLLQKNQIPGPFLPSSGNLSGPSEVPIFGSQGSGNYYHKGGICHNINILSMKKVNSDLM
jgi:hypothetical protein